MTPRTPLLILLPTLLLGCTETTPEKGREAVIALRDAPVEGLPVDNIMLLATNFNDSDENGYCDTCTVIVYLFSSQSATTTVAVRGEGAFEFILYEGAGRRLARWSIDQEAAEAGFMKPNAGLGWGYVFSLDLNDVGSDEIPSVDGRLRASYFPAEGRPVSTPQTASVVIGPVRTR